MTGSSTQPTVAESMADAINLAKSVVRRARRYWVVFVLFVALAPVAFLVAPRFRVPLYKSEATLMIREGLQSETVLGGAETGGNESRRSRNARLSELLLSRPNLKSVIEDENVYPTTVARLGITDAIEELRRNIKITAGEGNTFTIQFDDGKPDIAQRVTRRLAQSMVQQVGRDSERIAESTRKFLEAEHAKVSAELKAKEEQVVQFLAIHPEFALERTQVQATGPGLATRPAAPSDPAAALRRQADRLRRRIDQLNNPGVTPVEAPPEPAPPQLTPESREAIAAGEREVQRAREELESRQAQYTPLHPDVMAAKSRLSSAQDRLARIRAAAKELAVAPRPVVPVNPPRLPAETPQDLEKQLRTIEGSIAWASRANKTSAASPQPQASGSAEAIVSLETQWATLNRDLMAVRERNESIQRRLFQAVILAAAQSGGGGTQMVVVDEAYLPGRPYKRGPVRTGGVAALIVLALGSMITLGLGYLDQRVATAWDVTQLGIGPIAMVVPRVPRRLARRSTRD